MACINPAPAGEFNEALADFLIVGQCGEPNTFARVVLGGLCETKTVLIGGHRQQTLMFGLARVCAQSLGSVRLGLENAH